jgi:hypothetical protein
MSEADTSPERLKLIQEQYKYLNDGVVKDLLAMIEELKDQLDKAKEDIIREARGADW